MRYILIVLLTVLVIGCSAEQEQAYREKYEPIFKNETQSIIKNTTQQIVENLSKQNEELKRQLENINRKLSGGAGEGGSGGGRGGENISQEERLIGFVNMYKKCLAEAQKQLADNPELTVREAILSSECPRSRVLLKDEVEGYEKAIVNLERTIAEIRLNETIRQNETLANQSFNDPNDFKEFKITAKQFEFDPSIIEANKGDKVRLIVTSMDVPHGFSIPEYGINERLDPGVPKTIEFVADMGGTFTVYCSVFCGSGHSGMKGKLIVQENVTEYFKRLAGD